MLRHALAVVLLPLAACSDAAVAPSLPASRTPPASPRAVAPTRVGEDLSSTPHAPRPSAPEAATLAVLAEGLAAPDYATRLLATEALACVPAEAALPALAHQLGDPEADVRATALVALHHHTDPRAAVLLRSVRDDTAEDLALRVLAASSLVSPRPSCR